MTLKPKDCLVRRGMHTFFLKNKFLSLATELAHFPIEIPAHFHVVGHTVFEVQDSNNDTVEYIFKLK